MLPIATLTPLPDTQVLLDNDVECFWLSGAILRQVGDIYRVSIISPCDGLCFRAVSLPIPRPPGLTRLAEGGLGSVPIGLQEVFNGNTATASYRASTSSTSLIHLPSRSKDSATYQPSPLGDGTPADGRKTKRSDLQIQLNGDPDAVVLQVSGSAQPRKMQ